MPNYNDMSVGYGYEQIIENAKDNQNFATILPYLRDLQAQFKYYTTPNKNQGNMIPALDAAGRNKYLNTLGDALKELAKLQNSNTLDTEDKKTLEKISSSLNGDSYAVSNYDPAKGYMNMVHIFESNRPIVVDITGDKIKTVGGMQSTRLPFVYNAPNGESYDGFFTENVEYNPEKDWDNYAESVDYNPEIKNFVECLEDAVIDDVKKTIDYYISDPNNNADAIEKFGRGLKEKITTGKISEINKSEYIEAALNVFFVEELAFEGNELVTSESALRRAVDLMKSPDVPQNKASKYAQAIDYYNREKNNGMMDFIRAFIGSNGNKCALHQHAGVQPESRIDSRNAAMSSVADLLGKPKLISKAIPMSIQRDGKVINGTFMATAEGIDANHRTEENKNIRSGDLNKSPALASLADLQVIDFICGNIDRHGGNFIYQQDKTTGKITSVIGIDNDLSFGTFVPKSRTDRVQDLTSLNRMVAITSSMSERIKSITKDQLMQTLAPFQLNDKQKEACWQRLDMLRTNVADSDRVYKSRKVSGFIPGKIKIVADEDFTKLNLNDLIPDTGRNLFEKTKRLDNPVMQRGARSKKDVTKKYYSYDAKAVAEYAKHGADVAARMKAATGIRGTSDEYEKLRIAVDEYAKFHEQRKGLMMSEGDIILHDTMLTHIDRLTDKYLERYEKKTSKSTYAKDRANLVMSIKSEFADKKIQNKLTKDDRKLIHENDERNMERQGSEMRAKAQIAVMKGMLEADGRMLKDLTKSTAEDFTNAAKRQLLHAVIANKYCDKNMNIKLEDFSKVQNLLQKVEKSLVKMDGLDEEVRLEMDEYLKDFEKPNFVKNLEDSKYFKKIAASFATQKGRERYAAAVQKEFKIKENGSMEKKEQPKELTSALEI